MVERACVTCSIDFVTNIMCHTTPKIRDMKFMFYYNKFLTLGFWMWTKVVLGFFKESCFFVGGREFLLLITLRQRRSPNGDVVVFDSIEIFVSFSSVWYVCVATRCKMTMWQGNYQVKCTWRKSHNATTKGCATM